MAHGGRRAGSGRPKGSVVVTGFRDKCRELALSKEVWEGVETRAKTDPEFALHIAEHGFGRPPQALDITHRGDPEAPLVYRASFADGAPVPAPAVPVPAPGGGGPQS